jgi:hypothetical protein
VVTDVSEESACNYTYRFLRNVANNLLDYKVSSDEHHSLTYVCVSEAGVVVSSLTVCWLKSVDLFYYTRGCCALFFACRSITGCFPARTIQAALPVDLSLVLQAVRNATSRLHESVMDHQLCNQSYAPAQGCNPWIQSLCLQ